MVEDEPLLLMNIADELSEAGFDVIESPNASHALRQFSAHEIGLMVTDVDMPGPMDGLELSSLVQERWPHVAIIVTSGKLAADQADLPPDVLFIPKPYAASELIRAINAALDE